MDGGGRGLRGLLWGLIGVLVEVLGVGVVGMGIVGCDVYVVVENWMLGGYCIVVVV